MENTFKIGVNVFVVRDGKLLLGKRKNGHGSGEWGLPGGHLEFNEKFADGAKRELFEETGLVAENLLFETIANQPRGDKHYVQIGFSSENVVGEPELKEPEYCEVWQWFSLDNLPDNLYSSHIDPIRLFKEKKTFYE